LIIYVNVLPKANINIIKKVIRKFERKLCDLLTNKIVLHILPHHEKDILIE